MKRCEWASNDLEIEYHDKEWGRPVYDDKVLFEFLVLEGAQAGLSWDTILKRRGGYKKIFSNFDYIKLSKLTNANLDEILESPLIIRNKLKVYSVRTNAIAFIEVQKEFGSFSNYIWSFTDNKVIDNNPNNISEILASTPLSEKISKDLKKRGFKFVGPTIVYAYMQAVGIVNDHIKDCWVRNI
ncbi:MAG: DNA-3-methyladenine glycosylase I [Bacilli bacterium]